MKIIPVIDLKNGVVVQAVRGDRSDYKPVQSQLCSGSAPSDLVTALLEATQSKILYIADLDAIEQTSSIENFNVIKDLARRYRHISFWVDAGFKSLDQLYRWKKIHNLRPVIGTESHKKTKSLLTLLQTDSILSLDFKNNQLLGPGEILNMTKFWPKDLIIMSLDTVGSQLGPNMRLINKILAINSDSRLYAAGGIRGQSDIECLRQVQVKGVLLASALHSGSIDI